MPTKCTDTTKTDKPVYGETDKVLDLLMSKKRSKDRNAWLEEKGHMAGMSMQEFIAEYNKK